MSETRSQKEYIREYMRKWRANSEHREHENTQKRIRREDPEYRARENALRRESRRRIKIAK